MIDEFKLNMIKNKSTTYMLPFVNVHVDFQFKSQLLNTYLSFIDGDDIFCVMYEWIALPAFLEFEGKMMSHHLYVGHEDYGSKTVYKFRLSGNMKEGREKFIKGDYTKFSENHKTSIMKHLVEINATNKLKIANIMNDLSPITSDAPDMKLEVFSNNIRKLELIPKSFEI